MDEDEQSDSSRRETACDAWLVVVRALRSMFPYIDVEEISRFEPLQDELDLTPSDFGRLMAAVSDQAKLEVPVRDYPLVSTLDDLEHYVASNADASAASSR